jgi:hypothetical protein
LSQVGLGVELVSPQPSCSEGLFLEVWPKVVMEPTREHEDSRGSPTEWHDCCTLVCWVVDARYNDPSVQDCLFGFTLDLTKVIRRVVRLAERS